MNSCSYLAIIIFYMKYEVIVIVVVSSGSALLSGILLALATYQSIYPLTLFAPALLFFLQVRV